MTTNPLILKLTECLAYVVEKDDSEELEFNLEINGAYREEGDEDEFEEPELTDFECITGMEMRTDSDAGFDRQFSRAHMKELLDLLRGATESAAAS